MRTLLIFWLGIIVFDWGLLKDSVLVARAEMSTSSFKITSDVVGSFGGQTDSANFGLGDTGGEMATGSSASANFGLEAGFWKTTEGLPYLSFIFTDSDVDLGILTPGQVRYDTAGFQVSSSAEWGYVVECFGSSPGFENNIIEPLNSPAGSTPGTEQFGLNLVENTSPLVGSPPVGGEGQAETGYNTTNNFKFVSGDTIASSAVKSNYTSYTASFIGNISPTTDSGEYRSDLVILATGKF